MPLRILLIALLTTLVALDMAHAAGSYEVRQQKAIFVLEGFQQWTNLKYQFDDQSSSAGTHSASNGLQENYNASLKTDIIGPHFFATGLSFSVGLDQNLYYNNDKSSAFGNAFRYSYQFTGSGLDRSITPFVVNSYKNTGTVSSPYSPSYTTNSTGNELQVSLLNTLLPSTFRFVRNTQENSGGGFNSSTTNNSFSYSAAHKYKDVSSTSLSFSASDASGSSSGGPQQGSSSYSAVMSNNYAWGKEKAYSLNSLAMVQDSKDQSVPQRSVNLSESFSAPLGEALGLLVSYTFSNTSILGFSDQQQETTLNQGEVTLTHRLFESVKTRLHGKVSSNDLLGGTEYRYSGAGDLAYTKRLPGTNRLTFAASGVHEVVDNRLGAPLRTIKDESHLKVLQGDIITLPLSGGLLRSVISVTSSSPFFTYSEGRDYAIDFNLGQIVIVRGGLIDMTGDGTDLRISYIVFNDPTLKYANDSLSVGAGITFLGGKYALGGSYQEQWMTLISGPSDNSLRGSSVKQLHFSGNLDRLNYRINYTDSIVGSLESQAFEGSGQLIADFSLGTFSFTGTERYSRYGATPALAAYGENTTAISAATARNISSNTRLTMSANVLDNRSELRGTRDIASLRGSLRYWLNKITISLDGKTAWTFSGGTTARDDSVSLEILRYF